MKIAIENSQNVWTRSLKMCQYTYWQLTFYQETKRLPQNPIKDDVSDVYTLLVVKVSAVYINFSVKLLTVDALYKI